MKGIKEILAGVLIAVVLIAGVLIRSTAGFPLIQSELIYAAPENVSLPEPDGPAAVVKRFYLLFDQGRYAEAWALSLEPDWSGGRKIRYQDELTSDSGRFMGWTTRETFIQRCLDDIGPEGIYLSLSHLRTREEDSSIKALPYKQVRSYPGITTVYRVQASGDFLASCAVYRWRKDLFVLETDKGYKVLLEGTKSSRELFHMNWLNFREKQLIGELRSQ